MSLTPPGNKILLITKQGTGWRNVEHRSYQFVDEGGYNASVVETSLSKERRRGSEIPLTHTEQMKLAESEKDALQAGEPPPIQAKVQA